MIELLTIPVGDSFVHEEPLEDFLLRMRQRLEARLGIKLPKREIRNSKIEIRDLFITP